MKYAFLIIAIFCARCVFAQTMTGRRTKEGTSVKGWEVNIGDTLYFGKGTGTNGVFTYIYLPEDLFSREPEKGMPRRYINTRATIKFFLNQSTRKSGKKIVAVCNPFDGGKYVVDLEPAIDEKEIIAINSHKFY